MKRLPLFLAALMLGTAPIAPALAREAVTADYAVGPQYDTTHVYVAPEDFDRFVTSLIATFGGTATVAIGVAGATGKYRAAAIFTAAAPTLFGVSTAADDDALTAEETVLLTIAAASLPGSGTGYVDLYYSGP